MDAPGTRKTEHLDIVASGAAQARAVTTGFENVRFVHVAAPELNLDAIDLSVSFLGHRLASPFLISSMTGGPGRSEAINRHLAEAATHLKIAFAVGSQRIALEAGLTGGLTHAVREHAKGVPLFANLGGGQLRAPYGLTLARRAVETIEADALIIHLNPLQEAVQAGGDRDWTGVLAAIAAAVKSLPVPVIVKEVGSGISGPLAGELAGLGVAAVDVAGAGGTSWAAVEEAQAQSLRTKAIAGAFRDWGIPTATVLRDVRACCPNLPLIASGGLKDGLDAAKAIRLGANICGSAAGILTAAMDSTQAVVDRFDVMREQLRIACFCTGSPNLAALRTAALVDGETGSISSGSKS